MIFDMILLLLLCAGSFVLGWWCHKQFGSADAMIDAGADKLKNVTKRADTPPPAPTPAPNKDEKY